MSPGTAEQQVDCFSAETKVCHLNLHQYIKAGVHNGIA
jgi:hypothetical protein